MFLRPLLSFPIECRSRQHLIADGNPLHCKAWAKPRCCAYIYIHAKKVHKTKSNATSPIPIFEKLKLLQEFLLANNPGDRNFTFSRSP